MLTHLALRQFQSHGSTELELGQFTVIVGASSSGKSAVVRALKLLANNARGTAYIRHGASTCAVEATQVDMFGDPPEAGIRVAIQRGKGSEYRLQVADDEVERFTKIGTSTPDAIVSALDFGFDDMWLAGQFDRPFLLDATGSAVAKTLGDLTNVSMIFAAVRECSRRASAAKSRHADRSAQLATARDRVMSFAALPGQRDAQSRAEEALSSAEKIRARTVTLRDLIATSRAAVHRSDDAQKLLVPVPSVQAAQRLVNRRAALASTLRALSDLPPAPAHHELPDLRGMQDLKSRASQLATMLRDVTQASARAEASRETAVSAGGETSDLKTHLDAALTAAGRCPVCGSSTTS